jgi:hypothetical protein
MNGQPVQNTFPQYQEQIQIICDLGYTINGTSTLTCNENQTYSDLPHCQSK